MLTPFDLFVAGATACVEIECPYTGIESDTGLRHRYYCVWPHSGHEALKSYPELAPAIRDLTFRLSSKKIHANGKG